MNGAKQKIPRKLIDIPGKELKILEKLAAKERMKVKPFLEKVLIEYANSRK